MEIKKVAVLGSGVMGSGIAAHIANAGVPVVLLDIVPAGASDRSVLTKGAIEKQLSSKIPGFTHKRNAKLVTCGNLEDDINLLAEVDWIVEAVLEKLEVKQDVYRKINAVRKKGSIVSSNTSTLPLATLLGGMPDDFKKDFMITHFFNPPRFMPLLEVTASAEFRKDAYAAMCKFADVTLGKGVVECKDTPGFLANRIGVYWMMVALLEAIEMGIDVEDADAIMGKPVGIPKTGVFGLFDLIGIDLMPLIAQAMLATLPESDTFRKLYHMPDLVKKMIADGYTGRKGKGGFYRMVTGADGKKTKEVINLKTGEYRAEKKSKLESVDAGKLGLAAVLGHKDIGGQFAARVMLKTLHYAASLVPEISDTTTNIDAAMKLGYNWKYGPFELIDRLAFGGMSGAQIFAAKAKEAGLPIPDIIAKTGAGALYKTEGGKALYLNLKGTYDEVKVPEGSLMLADVKLTQKPIAKNASASLWDMGDGVACFELTSKMNTFDPEVFKMLHKSLGIVQKQFKGLVIGTDAEKFSVGANLAFFTFCANTASWWAISDTIRAGQNAFMAMKYAPFPIVASLSGMALGGGCEILLHCDAVQSHIEAYPGLVEVGVGIVPGWGGCKEMILRHAAQASQVQKEIMSGKRPSAHMAGGPMPPISKAFEYISMAKVAGSAQEAQDMLILNAKSRISMNRRRVLADAKALTLELAQNYEPPQQSPTVRLPGFAGRDALYMAVDNFAKNGKATPHDVVVSRALAQVLTGGDTDITVELTEQDLLDLEHDVFMTLVKTEGTLARVQHMLETNKPLRN